jgi:hypothetical protein
MKPYYVSIKDEIQDEENFYTEEYKDADYVYLNESSELFLVHAYTHLLFNLNNGFEIFRDTNYQIKYGQFYLNLAIGLELLLKSILLKQGKPINKPLKNKSEIKLNPELTLQFREIINKHLDEILPRLDETTLEEIKDTLRLVNLRRNNIAQRKAAILTLMSIESLM